MTIRTAKLETRRTRTAAIGFTLTELLIAIAVFVVVLAMAVPVLRTLTGSRSIAQATNIISAELGRVRNEAIGFQKYRAVMFYLDPSTGRVGMATLGQVDINPVGTTWFAGWPADIALDMTDSEPVLLPPGIGLQAVINGTVAGSTRTGNGYIGFNVFLGNSVPMGGIVMFDPAGRLSLEAAGVALVDPTLGKTALGNFLFPSGSPSNNYASYGSSQLGFVLFESDQYLSQFGGDSAWRDEMNPLQYSANEKPKENWLDAEATPFLVNRYNGTLIKGE